MVSIQALIDDAKCFDRVRATRWPDGARCPGAAPQREKRAARPPPTAEGGPG
jgi:hypothetical protein